MRERVGDKVVTLWSGRLDTTDVCSLWYVPADEFGCFSMGKL